MDCGSDQMLQNFGCNCSTLPHGKTHMSFFTTKTYKRNFCNMFVRGKFFELCLPLIQIHGWYLLHMDRHELHKWKWPYWWWNGQHGGLEEMYHHPAEIINMDEIDQMMKFLYKLHLKWKMTIIQMIWFSSTWLTTSTLNLDFIHVTCVQGDMNMGFKIYTS